MGTFQSGINQTLGMVAGGLVAGKRIVVKYKEEQAKLAKEALKKQKEAKKAQQQNLRKRMNQIKKTKGGE